MDVTIIVGTFGSGDWYRRGHAAARAAREWHSVESVHVHDASLADARNRGAVLATTEWLCFLDADDALAAGYFEAMGERAGDRLLLAPAVAYGTLPPVTFHDRDLRHLNPCVIGTLVQRDLFCEVGGFFDEEMYEDWSLWLRCVAAGATIHHVAAAVYLAKAAGSGRNTGSAEERRRWYRHVQHRYAGKVPA